MPLSIRKNFIEVGNRLDQLGVSRADLVEVVDAMVSAGAECTENDPSGSRGWRRWQMGTRRLRELLCANEDWQKDETDQVASVLNRALSVRVVVCNTDDGTCMEGRVPRNRSKKGAATDRAVNENQSNLFEHAGVDVVVVPFGPEDISSGAITTLHLCVYHEGDDIRAELSCAVSSSGGYLDAYHERNFITGGEAGSGDNIKRRKPDTGDDSGFVIPVSRKK